MAAGCCGSDVNTVRIVGGNGIAVTGSGSSANPYRIENGTSALLTGIRVIDTESVNLTLTGSGTPDDPLTFRADTTTRLQDLTDVVDAAGPTTGDVPVWVAAVGGVEGHFEFRAPPVAPAGAVSTAQGLRGTGAAATPLRVATSGVWGEEELAGYGDDTTVGLAIYVDAAGELRAAPATGGTGSTWSTLAGKPSTFAPSAHTHRAADVSDPENLDVGRIGGKRVIVQQGQPATPAGGWKTGDLWISW
jgi:hypothetical protein